MPNNIDEPLLRSAVEAVAALMAVSAVTAPKAKGEDHVLIRVLTGDAVRELAAAMDDYGRLTGRVNYDRDARGVAASGAVLLVGLDHPAAGGLNCGACGYDLCDQLAAAERPSAAAEFRGPFCAYRLIDLGIALGSAVKTAGLLNVDNRIMYRIGAAARHAGIVDWEYAIGVPLSVSSKSIYFDR